MYLTLEYLNMRYRFWIDRIAEAGIWDKSRFQPVELIIRKRSKTCAGKFVRKYKVSLGRKSYSDSIIIYRKFEDSTEKEIDDILVHEMIHLYICQNNIKDTSSHGKIFKAYMSKINHMFQGDLTISLKDRSSYEKGVGNHRHLLLVLWFDNDEVYCCKINPKKIGYFKSFISGGRFIRRLQRYGWFESYDKYFDFFVTCNSRLQGRKMTSSQLLQLFEECVVSEILL